jgi:hypothetical protein
MTVNKLISEKWLQVYQTIPEDGSIIGFKDITVKLPRFSRSTIAQALDSFCHSGYVKKEIKSKKNVEYSRTNIMNKKNFDFWNSVNDRGGNLNVLTMLLMNPAFSHDALVELKNKGCDKEFMEAQAAALIFEFKDLDFLSLVMLYDYAKEPNKNKRISTFKTTLLLEYIPRLMRLIGLLDDVGLDQWVMLKLTNNRLGDLTHALVKANEETDKKINNMLEEYLKNKK